MNILGFLLQDGFETGPDMAFLKLNSDAGTLQIALQLLNLFWYLEMLV